MQGLHPRAIFSAGTLSPASVNQTRAPAVLFRCARVRDKCGTVALSTVSWTGHVLDGSTDQVSSRWAGAVILPRCIAAAGRAGRFWPREAARAASDMVRALKSPVSAGGGECPLEVNGRVTALWTESGGAAPWQWRTTSKRGDMTRSGLLLLAAASLSLTVAAAGQHRPHYGGTVRVAIQEAPASLDPADPGQPAITGMASLSGMIFDNRSHWTRAARLNRHWLYRGRLIPEISAGSLASDAELPFRMEHR